MALFQASVLNSHLAQLEQASLDKAYKKYQNYFWNTTIQDNIKTAKEEQYQATFLNELFVNILDYTLFPNPNPNLTTEFKNEKNARKADGAILKNDTAIGVIELKGTKTKDLESIRRQAFDYKANQKGCVYVITSNFEKLRFYINDATEFEEFDLFSLTQDRFNLLYLCLQKDKLLSNVPLQIKEASIAKEEEITKAFYKDYSIFKRELFRDLVKKNAKTLREKLINIGSSEVQNDNQAELVSLDKNVKLTLFQKSQKLIDRFLFIFFAEDRMLLPSNSTLQILNKWKDDWDFGDERPLYGLFKQYFNFLDIGRKGTEKRAEIYAYNGGLFQPDAILDALEIDNDLLYKFTNKLSNYDFDSQVDVNILGHIFENSLNEIESVNAEIESGEFDKQTSKRKKDGVFYTPKYITKYIVENTVGKLCEEKKAELGFSEEQYFKGRKNRNKTTIGKLVGILDTYRDWLLQITICDPACGSGAFLNQALDFLIKEHNYIDELKARVLGGGLQFPDIENTILENNIYGVDLNDESVEIAKLSLWLRTAQPRRKLNDLSSNIKCGNSLIDSKSVAGNKAFKWENEFPEIFKSGGFDVVIGNPPYVRVQFLNHIQIDWFKKNKKVAHKRVDISLMFFELAKSILKKDGLVSFITSNQFLTTEYGKNCRVFLKDEFKIIRIVDFADLPVFEGALTYVSIFTLRNSSPSNFLVFNVESTDKAKIFEFGDPIEIDYKSLNSENWTLTDIRANALLSKLSKFRKLSTYGSCNYGIVSGSDPVFIVEKQDIDNLKLEQEILLPLLRAENCKRYRKVNAEKYIIYPYTEINNKTVLIKEDFLKSKHPNAYQYLLSNKVLLEKRKDSRKTLEGSEDWYKLTRFGSLELFNKYKIVYPGETKHNKFGIDYDNSGYSGARVFSITLNDEFNSEQNLLSLLGVLNSSLIEFYLHLNAPLKQGGYFSYSSTILNKIPIPKEFLKINAGGIIKNILAHYEELEKLNERFLKYILNNNEITKSSRKLENWHELEFGDFIKELNKAIKATNKTRAKEAVIILDEKEERHETTPYEVITTLTKKDEFEWMELFEENKKKAQELQTQITATEKEIDQMVYELYGLTEEEIEIVEKS